MTARLQTPTDLIRIAESASTFEDRLLGTGGAAAEQEAIDARLAAWREAVAPGDPEAFERRLAWDGLDPAALGRLLRPRELPEGEETPLWLGTLGRIYGTSRAEAAAAFEGVDYDRVLDAEDPVPFEPLFLPVIRYARAEVRSRTAAAHDRFSPEAHRDFERALLRRISHICSRALYASFTMVRLHAQRASLAAILGGVQSSHGPYAQFVAQMRSGGIFDFFRTYSVAARLCATVTELWIQAVAEVIDRFAADLPELGRTFGGGEPLGRVTGVKTELADAHDGGRSVAILSLSSGTRIVYKPRSLELELFYEHLVGWVNDRDPAGPGLRAPRSVARPGYGWIEFMDHAPCASAEEVGRFYERTGMVLGLVYAFNGTDFHLENIIASGEHPVLIDLETLVLPRFAPEKGTEVVRGSDALVRERFRSSVTHTGLLPVLMQAGDGRNALDLGGLASDQTAGTTVEVTYWRNVNRDLMKLASRRVEADTKANVPLLAGENQYVTDHIEAVAHGFSRAYRLLLEHRGELLGEGGLVARLRGKSVRFLFRATNLYATLLERTLHPKYLRDGADRFIQLDALARPLLMAGERPQNWAVLRSEREEMERMDIPFFTARIDERGVRLSSGEEIPNFFHRSAYEEATAKLSALDEEDLGFQLRVIRMAFRATTARGVLPPLAPADRTTPEAAEDRGTLRERALAAAERVARALERTAVTSPEGGASWPGIGYLARSRRHMAGPLAYPLFDGYCGIGVFLAALARVSGSDRARRLALDAVQPLRDQLPAFARQVRARVTLDMGVATGLASAVYGFAWMGERLGEQGLVEDAGKLASLLGPEVAARDRAYDLSSGSAGAVIGLLKLHRVTGDDALVTRARAFGRHLLENRTESPLTGLRAWATSDGCAEAGMVHGATGIALALLRLHAATGEAAFLSAAEEALMHEKRLLATRWDAAGIPYPFATWGAGVPGLGFAQLEAPEGSSAREGLEASLRLARANLLRGDDSLCTGTLGRVDLLLTAGEALGDAELVRAALRGAAAVLPRADDAAPFELGWGHGIEHVGLFSGISGIGYQALRVADPAAVPSLLAWH